MQQKSFANEFVGALNLSSVSTDNDTAFGFAANVIVLRNRAAKSAYISINSTTGASTADYELGSSEALTLTGMIVSGMTMMATSSGGYVSVGAWGM